MGITCLFFAGEGLSQRDTGGESLPCGYSGWKCGLEGRLPGFISWICFSSAMGTRTDSLTSDHFGFFICKLG